MNSAPTAYVPIYRLTCPNGHSNMDHEADKYPCSYLHYGTIRRKIGDGDPPRLIEKYVKGARIVYLAHCSECNTVFMDRAFVEDEVANCHCLECEIVRAKAGKKLLDEYTAEIAPVTFERARAGVPLAGHLSENHEKRLATYRQHLAKPLPTPPRRTKEEHLRRLEEVKV